MKPHLNCDLNFVMKSSRKWLQPLLELPNCTFPLLLSSSKQPWTEFIDVDQLILELDLGVIWFKKLDVKFSYVYIR